MPRRPILLDECCSKKLVKYLQDRGEVVVRIGDGRPDEDIVDLARETGSYIITKDKHFRNYEKLVRIVNKEHYNSIYWRLQMMERE